MKKILLLLVCAFAYLGTQSQTLYFKCTSGAAGVYNWGTLANWYTNAACTTTAAAIPSSSNDVIIGPNTFTANGQSISFDQTTMSCKGFSVTYAGAFTSCSLTAVAGKKLTVFGHFDFTGFDNTKLSIVKWNGDVELNPANIGTLNVLTDKKALYLDHLYIPGNTTQYTVNFNDSLFLNRSAASAAIAQLSIAPNYTLANAVTVNFNDLVKIGYTGTQPGDIVINAGTVNFNNGIFCTGASVVGGDISGNVPFTGGIRALNGASVTLLPQTLTNGSYPTARNRSEIYGLLLLGNSSTVYPTFNATNQTLTTWGGKLFDYSNVNFSNSILNSYNSFTATALEYWSAKATASLTLSGSTLTIGSPAYPSTGYLNFGNQDYNIVNINQNVVYGQSLNGGFQMVPSSTPSFNKFIVTAPIYLWCASNGTPIFTIKAGGTFSMAPGSSYVGNGSTHTFSISPTASVSLVGNCAKTILLNNTNINFSNMPAANLSADYLILDGSIATGTATPYNAGANSLKIYNTTTTGWTVPCMPATRTVYWQGPLAGGNWSNPNNWSLINTASPASPTTPITSGACLPTYRDSVVFPASSLVTIDLTNVYTKSVRIVSTATISSLPAMTLTGGGALWNVSGGWWATNKFKNGYNGQVVFNTFEYPHLIKTGGVPFGGTGSAYPITFKGTYPPNGSCLPDNTKHKGGWLILDTLATCFTGNYAGFYFLSGVLKTYSADPAYAAYYPATQKKGSTLVASATGGASSFAVTDTKDTISLYDSDIYLYMASGSNNMCLITLPNKQLNEGTAEFICNAGSSYPIFGLSPAGNRLNEISVKTFSYTNNASFNQMAIQNIAQANTAGNVAMRLALYANDTVDVINNYQGLVISANGTGTLSAGYTRKLTSTNANANSYLSFDSGYNGGMANYFIDTLYTNTPTSVINTATTYSMNFTIRKLMHINGGGVTLKMGNSNAAQFDNNATITFSPNATFKSDGTCSNRNLITSYTPLGTATVFSKMILQGAINQTLTATDIQDNIVSGGTLNTDGFTNGTTTNWNVTGSAPRLLHWTDGVTAGGTTLDWSNTNRWRKAVSGSTSLSEPFIVWSASPECPPTCQDTVLVDNSSFSSTLDSVQINTVNYQAQVGKFYWRTTAGAPGFSGVPSAVLSICDSLYFSPFMANRYRGEIVLKGSSVAGTRSHGLKFANQKLKNRLVINCTNSATTYQMRDSLYVDVIYSGAFPNNFTLANDYPSVLHVQGNLNTNGNTMNLYRYTSVGNLPRKLIADNSKIRLRGSAGNTYNQFPQVAWIVANHGAVKTYSISTKNTRFILNVTGLGYGSGMVGGGYNYNDVEFYGSGGQGGKLAVNYSTTYYAGYDPKSPTVVDTFRNVYNNMVPTTINDRLIIGPTTFTAGPVYSYTPVTKCIIKNVYNNTAPMDIQGSHCYIDSLECYYRNATYGTYNLLTSNDYYKHFGLYGATAPQTINLAPDSVQWLHNLCDFRPAGNNTNKVNLFSRVNGQKTYFRKDSARVCADWLVLKDIWAVGSGASLGPVTTPLCTQPAATIYKCDWDTLSTFDGTGYGPLTAITPLDPNFTFSKRAWFQGGNGTDFQTNNRGWEMKSTEADPVLNLSSNSTICEGDTTTITFNVQGVFPFNLTYFTNTNSPTFPAVNNNTLVINFFAPTSFTQTPATATYSNSSSPTGYVYYLVPQNGTATNAGTPANPFILSLKVTPTVTTRYSLGSLLTGKCVNNVTSTVTATGQANVTVNPAPKNIITAVTPSVLCTGNAVTYTVNATNGNVYYIYSVPSGTTGITTMNSYTVAGPVYNGSLTVNTLTAGTTPTVYTRYIGAESQFGCQSLTRTPVTVTINPIPQITSTASQSICSGISNTISVLNTFTTSVTNSWSSSAVAGISGHSTSGSGNASETLVNTTTAPLTVLYTYTPSAYGCSGTAKQFSVTVNPTPVMTSATNTTICSGGSLNLALASNISSAYQWQAGDNTNTTGESLTAQSTASVTDAIVNSTNSVQQVVYSVTPTSTLGNCIGTPQTVTVNVNPAPLVTSLATATICSGNALNIGLTSNVASTYTWVATSNTNVTGESISNQTSNTINNTLSTPVGTAPETVFYTVTPMSSVGNCLGTAQQVTVTVNSLPSVIVAASTQTVCSGTNATLTATGANTYTWTNGPVAAIYTITPSSNTTYTVAGTNTLTGCSNTQTITQIVSPSPTVNISASSATICSGGTTILTAGTANSYAWSGGPSTAAYTVSPASTTVYTVTGTNTAGSCTATAMYTVNVNPTPTVNIAASNATICSGQSTTLTAGAANSYNWTSGPSTAAYVVSPTSTTVYTVTGTNTAGSCTATAMYTVNVNSTPTVNISASSATICAGGTTTLTAGTANSYAWSGGPSTAVYAVSPTATTVYTVTGTNTTGSCTATAMYTVTVNPLPTFAVSSQTNVSCFGLSNGSASFTTSATSPTISGTGVSGNTAAALAPGAYTYTITDGNGCNNTTTLSITQPTSAVTAIAAVTATNSSCTNPNGSISITATGGTPSYSYAIDGGAATTSSVNGSLSTGTHSYVVSDANGCTTSTGTIAIAGTPGITSSVASQLNVLCYGNNTGSVSVSATGGASYTYTLTPITATTAAQTNNTGTFTGLSQGTYSVLVKEQTSNCISNNMITINSPSSLPTISSVNNPSVTCFGSSATVSLTASGGTPSYTYTWQNHGASATTTQTYTVGNYTVQAVDANGCSSGVQSFTVSAPSAAIQITSVATTTTGCGLSNGTISFNASGGWSNYTYTITNSIPAVISNTNSANGLPAGTYTATVTDALTCSTSTVFTISNPSTPTLSIASPTLAICSGQSATLSPTGASSYTLAAPSQTFTGSISVSPSVTTVYNITGTDASNCISAPMTVTVAVSALPSVSVAATHTAICTGSTATLTASGANIYTWSSSSNTTATEIVSPSAQTVYTVVGTNTLTGCSSNPAASYTVNVNTLPTASVISQQNILCFGQANGSVNIAVTPSTAVMSPTLTTNLSVGVHSFTVSENGCSSSITVTITAPSQSLSATVTGATSNNNCITPNGTFTVTASGGTPGTPSYTYNASNTNTTGVFTSQSTGSHVVTVNDANGCTYTVTAIIPGVPTPSVSAATQTNVSCSGQSNGMLSVTVVNGSPSYTYVWSNNSSLNSSTQNNLPAGTYTVTATDAGSCTVTHVFTITEPTAINAQTQSLTNPCVGQNNGALSILVTGGTPDYEVSWSNGATTAGSSSGIANLKEGQYTATITDQKGCQYLYPVQLDAQNGVGCTLIIPEIFSPNGDGKNDLWEIKGLENYPDNKVTVFNRWGDQVYNNAPYKNDWDGQNTGDKSMLGKGILPAGTYYFILDLSNGDKPITGYVQITR